MKVLCCAIALTAAAAPALAQTGSNIGLTQYPAPQCDKPQRDASIVPPPTPDNPSNLEAEAYNAKIKKYNAGLTGYNNQMAVYNICIQAYIVSGNADMRRIRDALDAAVAAANAH